MMSKNIFTFACAAISPISFQTTAHITTVGIRAQCVAVTLILSSGTLVDVYKKSRYFDSKVMSHSQDLEPSCSYFAIESKN